MVVMDENLWTPHLTEINVDESLNSSALNVKESTAAKNQTNATSVAMHPLKQAL